MNETRAPTNEEIRAQVLEDYRNGEKPKVLSEKTGISINTIKSWISRDKKKNASAGKDAPKLKKGASPNRKKGAPIGNKNARGNRGGAAPLRNTNAEKHGAFSKIYFDSLDEEEQEMIREGIGDDEEMELSMQIQIFSVRERRFMRRIENYKAIEEKNHGLAVKSVSKTKDVEKLLSKDGENIIGDRVSEKTVTNTEAVMNSIMALEAELTKVQRAKTKAIESLIKYRSERDKLLFEKERDSREADLHNLRKELLDAQIEHMDAQTNKLLGTDVDLEDTSDTDALVYGSYDLKGGGADEE